MATQLSDPLTALGFNTVIERLASYAQTSMGRQSLLHLTLQTDPQVLVDDQASVGESVRWIEQGLPTALGAADLAPLLERVRKGGVLAASELVNIRRTTEIFAELTQVVEPANYPQIAQHVRGVTVPQSVIDAIAEAIDADGLVRDQASASLLDIRRQIHQIEREIDDVFDRILKSGQWLRYLQDALVTVRYGRRVIPVKNEFRNNVPGIVHDQSGSGQTVFIEPLAVVERQNRLTIRRQEEAREIERILAALTAKVAQVTDVLSRIQTQLAWFDNRLARARYGLALNGTFAKLGGEQLQLVGARHPLLENPVPISISLSRQRPAVIITGPNTGGKTVALKTVGLVTVMALAGLMVPAEDGTVIPIYHQILADIGDEQSLEQSLSTFSAHLLRLIAMLTQADAQTLCLVDEIGAGTDPEEGSVLAEVMVRHLVDRQASLIASTHYSRLKLLALRDPRIQNALVEFDRETLTPTYHLVMGAPGSSHAFYIARRLGLPEFLVDQAEQLLDEDAMHLSDAIVEINRLEQALRVQEEALRTRESELQARERQVAERESRLEQAWQREREKTLKAWRRELDEMRDKFGQALELVRQTEGRERARALEQLREQYRGLAQVPKGLVDQPAAGTPPEKVGERVRVAGFSEIGTVTELAGRTATVEIGALRMKLLIGDLERVGDTGEAPAKSVRVQSGHRAMSQEKSRTLGLEVDLRGMTQEEALEVLDKYLDDAVLAGAPFVRIIHGKGTGVLRRAVGQALRGDSRVVRYRLGESGEGGDGVTVAILEEPL
ncbi:MAG: endonuclease MutS2 [Sulfobacillus acidophilus]|uniref:Endonuclease MutS2 n=1 Tax=Sulfobacillus acidophilus TaxID=53633 RepID=A0A2T2WIV8_9FIRM|nr:MAG: endonuclease MutS2 [Sulfobacillus acidophilus]